MKIGTFEIGYMSDNVPSDYAAMLDAVTSLAELREGVKRFAPFVWMDAPSIERWNDSEFAAFKKFLKREREARGGMSLNSEADMDKFSPIVMPMPMFDISIYAAKFQVPFGCMLIRGVELGRYKIKNERIVIKEERKDGAKQDNTE